MGTSLGGGSAATIARMQSLLVEQALVNSDYALKHEGDEGGARGGIGGDSTQAMR